MYGAGRYFPNHDGSCGTYGAFGDLSDHQIPSQVSIMGKARHPISNWSQYNKSLIKRGSLTFWVDEDAVSNWFHDEHHGRRGRSPLYTDQAICTALILKGIFKLPLRAVQGLLDSLFELMNVPLCAPISVASASEQASQHGQGTIPATTQG